MEVPITPPHLGWILKANLLTNWMADLAQVVPANINGITQHQTNDLQSHGQHSLAEVQKKYDLANESICDTIYKLCPRVPIVHWPRTLTLGIVKADLIAGFSTGINMLVKAIAFAELAGLRAEYGIFSATVPVLVYAVFGGSKDLGVGPSPLVCLLLMQFCSEVCDAYPEVADPEDLYNGNCTEGEYVEGMCVRVCEGLCVFIFLLYD
jgi:hypothetical protein